MIEAASERLGKSRHVRAQVADVHALPFARRVASTRCSCFTR